MVVWMSIFKDLYILLSTDAKTFARYQEALAVMEAKAELTKAVITAVTWEYRWRLKERPALPQPTVRRLR